MTRYINIKGSHGIETIDQFTMGEDAPSTRKEFVRYIREMLKETSLAYQGSGIRTYLSSRSTKQWRSK